MPWNFQSKRKFERTDRTGDQRQFSFQLPVTHEYPQLALKRKSRASADWRWTWHTENGRS